MQLTIDNYFAAQGTLNKREKLVYETLQRIQPATSWDLLHALGQNNPNYVRPRLTDLRKKGYISVLDKIEVNGIKQCRWAVII